MFANKLLNKFQIKRKLFNRDKSFCGLLSKRNCNTKVKQNVENKWCIKDSIQILDKSYITDEWTNVTPKILSLIGRNLYLKSANPIYLLSEGIREFFRDYDLFCFNSPVVDLNANFDSLLVAKDHVSRSKSDTYYVNKDYVLRSHTSAHQNHCLEKNSTSFVCIADVYRRDEINSTHNAAFHQCEVFRTYSSDNHQLTEKGVNTIFESSQFSRTPSKQEHHDQEAVNLIESLMKSTIESYVKQLLGSDLQMRWVSAYFPFTHPSWELEIYHNQKWIEILGSGIVEHKLLTNAGHNDKIGWALGMGLERLAMLRYGIPDIRLFWTSDTGFLSQFENAKHSDRITYKPISIHPQLIFDISFWLPQNVFWSPNDFHDVVRNIGGDLIEQVKLIDEWTNQKDGKTSNTYRIVYRSYERMLTKDEVNVIHKEIETYVIQKWNVKVR